MPYVEHHLNAYSLTSSKHLQLESRAGGSGRSFSWFSVCRLADVEATTYRRLSDVISTLGQSGEPCSPLYTIIQYHCNTLMETATSKSRNISFTIQR